MLTREAARRGMKPARLFRELAVSALREIAEKEASVIDEDTGHRL